MCDDDDLGDIADDVWNLMTSGSFALFFVDDDDDACFIDDDDDDDDAAVSL